MDAIDVTVVLLTQNSARVLSKTLAHLEQQTFPAGRFEVLVVDCGSTDQTREIVERQSEGSPIKIRTFHADRSTTAAARNIALRESNGRWVLFLDVELLASPRLVASHVRAQDQHGGNCVIVGQVDRHPQAEGFGPPHSFAEHDAGPFTHNQPLRFVDWRSCNLSVAKGALAKANGFDESVALSGLEDVELAWRLEASGLQGFYSNQAIAYSWWPVDIEREIAKRYSEGFSLWHALEKTHSEVLAYRYFGAGTLRWSASELAFAPLYEGLCRAIARHARPFEWVCRRISRTAVIRGYRDARRGKPSRYRTAAR